MKRFAIPLTLIAAATLAACGTAGNTGSTRAVSAVGPTYVASSGSVPLGTVTATGSGTVTALLDPTGPYSNRSWQLVTMRMDADNSVQTFAVEGVQLEFFERIRVNQDGSITRRLPK